MNTRKLKLLLTLLFLIVSICTRAQNTKAFAELIGALNTASTDTSLIEANYNLGEFLKADKPDSALYFFTNALHLLNKLPEAEIDKNIDLKSNILRSIGLCYKYLSVPDKAIEFYSASLQLSIESNNKLNIFKCYNNFGTLYYGLGNYAQALSNYFNGLRIAENLPDKSMLSACYLNIGIIFYYQNNYDKALLYYNKALNINMLLHNESDIANCYINIGVVLMSKIKLEAATNYFKRAKKIYEKLEDKSGILNCYTNLGDIYKEQKKYSQALDLYKNALELSRYLGDKSSTAYLYLSLAKLYLQNNSHANVLLAINYGSKAQILAHNIKAMQTERDAADILLKAYKLDNKTNLALHYAELYLKLNDSLYSKDKATSMAETEVKFRTERKQMEIDQLNQEKKLQQSENSRQKIVIFCTLAGIVLLIIFAIFIINRLKITRSQKKTIEGQKNQIEKILHNVNQSIDYATLIQSSVLPEKNSLQQYFDSNFVLYLPKDRVSGDFYWWAKINDTLIITVADCTGHGVPGALMSMLGSSLLREIVEKEQITSPEIILRKLREEIIKALKQADSPKAQKDGMDMALISINLTTQTLHFSGANNSLYIVHQPNNNSENILEEIKADKMPIAIYERMDNFASHEVQLQKNDVIYLFSDGYSDQFGGPKSKKFMSRNFKILLSEIAHKPMDEQHSILSKTIEDWKSSHLIKNKQIDDITVLGIKI